MSELEHNPAFSKDDCDRLQFRMVQLLSRRRSLAPWPLTPEETPLLWWPRDSYKLLNRLEALGGFDQAFSSTTLIQVRMPKWRQVLEPGGSLLLIIRSTGAMPSFNHAPGKPSGDFDLVTTGGVAEKFDDWFQKAKVIHAWNQITLEILEQIMSSSNSWGQLRKAFPEMYDLLADVDTDDHESWKYAVSDARIAALLKYFRNQGHAGAHDKVPDELKAVIRARKGPLIEVMKQALTLDSKIAMSGVLDASPFRKTWFAGA